jgi:uncharacterized protein DUF4157
MSDGLEQRKPGSSSLVHDTFSTGGTQETPGPGKRTLTQQLTPDLQTGGAVSRVVQRKAPALDGAPQVDASQAVHAAAEHGIAGSSSPLPYADQIQRAFGHHDVSNIQAHSDGAAETGAHAMGAQAFATGNHVAFAGTPDLHTAAHEAAHVVQQRGGVHLKGGVGVEDDSYERHADAVADRVVAGESAQELLDQHAPAKGATSSGPNPAVQRAPKASHYGTFTDEKYAISGGGLDMTLKFTPNDQVDATKIGLSQTARATVGGNKIASDPNVAKRMGPDGSFVDRISDKNTPVYGSDNLGPGKGLSDTPQSNNRSRAATELNPDNGRNATYDLGHRFQSGAGWVVKDAGLYDRPSIQGSNNSSSEFETTAVALAGAQKGEFYGSVKWGWKKDGVGATSKVDFDIVSMGVPSKNFLVAAAKWNSARTRGTMTPVANGTRVFDGSLAEKFTIDTGVEATLKQSATAGDEVYAFIEITTGAHAGSSGYVKANELRDKGDGSSTVSLPTPTVMVVTGQTPLYADDLQKTRLQSVAQGARVKVLATKGLVKQVQFVDGADTGKTGWLAASRLANEA